LAEYDLYDEEKTMLNVNAGKDLFAKADEEEEDE